MPILEKFRKLDRPEERPEEKWQFFFALHYAKIMSLGPIPKGPLLLKLFFFLISENSGNSEVFISSLGVQLYMYHFCQGVGIFLVTSLYLENISKSYSGNLMRC